VRLLLPLSHLGEVAVQLPMAVDRHYAVDRHRIEEFEPTEIRECQRELSL
jgi:hypothetical protein